MYFTGRWDPLTGATIMGEIGLGWLHTSQNKDELQ